LLGTFPKGEGLFSAGENSLWLPLAATSLKEGGYFSKFLLQNIVIDLLSGAFSSLPLEGGGTA